MRCSTRTLTILLFAALSLSAWPGCNPHGDVGMRERLPVIELSPEDLCGGLAAGCGYEFLASEATRMGSATTELTIFNPGEGPLEIYSVLLDSDDAGAFTLLLPDGLSAALDAGEAYRLAPLKEKNPDLPQEVSLRIRYTPGEEGTYPSARVLIENNSTNKTTVKVNLSVRKSAPKIQVSPEVVDFGRVDLGDTAERTVNVLNVGGEALTIEELHLDGSLDFVVTAGGQEISAAGGELAAPLILPPNTISALKVRFEPSSASPADGSLLIYSDDPGVAGATQVLLLGNQTAPCISVNPQAVNFGTTQVGTTDLRPLEITACGGAPLTLAGLHMKEGTSAAFHLAEPLDEPVVIPIGGSVTVNVAYEPAEENPLDGTGAPIPDLGTVIVESDALMGDVEVPLEGVGMIKPCPTAVIQVAEGEEVVPQTTLHLYGDQSYAPSGSVVKWEWSVDQPQGSQSVFVPSMNFPNPTFETNVAGLYRFYLTVRDENGLTSCEPAMAEVMVISDWAIHVELLWHTPEDPDETDEGPEAGSDMDLHFLHPWAGGPDRDGDGQPDGWFDQPFDCFWFNAHPEWGSFAPSVEDNPALDRDDTDGAGPENINLRLPEDTTYRVGVHYWDDHGYGASYATVRVYIYGNLVFEVSNVKLVDLDMWEVCTIEWPSGKVQLVTELNGAQYKITPAYISPFYNE